MSRQRLLHFKSVRHLVQWSLRSLETLGPEVAALGKLQPRAFRSLNCIETLDSVSDNCVASNIENSARVRLSQKQPYYRVGRL